MKKTTNLLVLFMVALMMTACGNEQELVKEGDPADYFEINQSVVDEHVSQILPEYDQESVEEASKSLWEMYNIIPGITWEYDVDDETTIFANVTYNEDGSASVQGFAYVNDELAEEYLIDKTLYSEDGIYYTTEDGNFDMVAEYSDSVEFVDWENGLFEGTFSLVADEETDDFGEVIEIVSVEEAKDFFRDSANIGTIITFEGLYATELTGYHKVAMYGDIDMSVMVKIDVNDDRFFIYDNMLVTGEFIGFDSFYDYPVIVPTSQTTLIK